MDGEMDGVMEGVTDGVALTDGVTLGDGKITSGIASSPRTGLQNTDEGGQLISDSIPRALSEVLSDPPISGQASHSPATET